MQSYEVFLDSFVTVTLPDGVDPESEKGVSLIRAAATAGYLATLRCDEVDFIWKPSREGGE